jgi:hypothetical protein
LNFCFVPKLIRFGLLDENILVVALIQKVKLFIYINVLIIHDKGSRSLCSVLVLWHDLF